MRYGKDKQLYFYINHLSSYNTLNQLSERGIKSHTHPFPNTLPSPISTPLHPTLHPHPIAHPTIARKIRHHLLPVQPTRVLHHTTKIQAVHGPDIPA